jgi:hypothetical protein
MRKLILIMAVLTISSSAFALTEKISMGGIDSVITSGAMDAGRNPALIPFEKENFSFVTAGSYRSLPQFDTSSKASLPVNTMTIDSDKPKVLAFNGMIGFISRGERSGFGLLITSNGDPAYERTKNKMTRFVTDGTNTNLDIKNSTETKYNLAINLSWGIRTSDMGSFGLRLIGGYDDQTTDSTVNINHTISGTLIKDSSSKQHTRYIYGTLIFGFNYRDEKVEAGAMFSTGQHGRYTDEVSYSFSNYTTVTTGSDSIKKTTPYLGKDAPFFLLGLSYHLSPEFQVGFEFATEMNKGYTRTDLVYDPETSVVNYEKKEYNTKYKYAGRIGLKYQPIPWISIMMGGQMIIFANEKNNNSGSDKHEKNHVFAYIYSIGTDFYPSDSVAIGISAVWTYFNMYGSMDLQSTHFSNNITVQQADLVIAAMVRL